MRVVDTGINDSDCCSLSPNPGPVQPIHASHCVWAISGAVNDLAETCLINTGFELDSGNRPGSGNTVVVLDRADHVIFRFDCGAEEESVGFENLDYIIVAARVELVDCLIPGSILDIEMACSQLYRCYTPA